uniref:Uncharacterized protein n=1 Tax=Glossina austeni TaxID=7395 RepID=A0A1A9UYM3_GLOAU
MALAEQMADQTCRGNDEKYFSFFRDFKNTHIRGERTRISCGPLLNIFRGILTLFNNFPQNQIQEYSWLRYPAIGILKCSLESLRSVARRNGGWMSSLNRQQIEEENVSRGDDLLPANAIESDLTYQNTFTNENDDELRDFPQEINEIQRKTVVISHMFDCLWYVLLSSVVKDYHQPAAAFYCMASNNEKSFMSATNRCSFLNTSDDLALSFM